MADNAALQRIHDRIISTPNEKLAEVLTKLIPGLLPLTNNDITRKDTIAIVSTIIRRVKAEHTQLPCSTMLTALVKEEMLPFCCNIAISLLDIAIGNTLKEDRLNCAISLLKSFESLPRQFSKQTDALVQYAIELYDEIPLAIKSYQPTKDTLDFVFSWFLDIAILSPGLKKDSIGSVQPGLSVSRVSRLTRTRDFWDRPFLTQLKLRIITSLSLDWMDHRYAAAIAVACLCDSDTEVSKHGMFRMNGLRSSLKTNAAYPLSGGISTLHQQISL